uniref:Uncharacterized protein n=1 Tax=uncultured Desulfobacterium sp. TaxID=201089 RepID=E1YCX1_9BACT|nr:unknown protein [uncultured Desulfobacterium sp.]
MLFPMFITAFSFMLKNNGMGCETGYWQCLYGTVITILLYHY